MHQSIHLTTLFNIEIRLNSHKLFQSYLADRKKSVDVKDMKINKKKIQCGVPQGTVLEPILFCIYVNGLFSARSSGIVTSFRDDTAIFYSGAKYDEGKERTEKDLEIIIDWVDQKTVLLYFGKTHCLPLSNNKSTVPHFETIKLQNTYKIATTAQSSI